MGTHSIYIELIAVLMTAVPKDSNEAVARERSNGRDKRIGTTPRSNIERGMPVDRVVQAPG
ncbi:hypothetical protein [Paraburkholderia sp. BL23I1N1]|uniref:hypothetical protein n=1 Tax=Paraburkholderia sp. BL23I1N1 TaxID=1938802 RepID=UPI000E76A524|nr:hypothetical protein [Paraburkholderia sp. BL23I1N1]